MPKKHNYDEPRPLVTVDCVVFTLSDDEPVQLETLLIKRAHTPYKGKLALPGGKVNIDEGLEKAAHRELREETGFKATHLEQLFTFGEPRRDSTRGRVISVAYFALMQKKSLKPGSDADNADWVALKSALKEDLAFDHKKILTMARDRLQAKVQYAPIGFDLLPEKFTMTQLQRLYECVLDKKLDKRNFWSKIKRREVLRNAGKTRSGLTQQHTQLVRFDKDRYQQLEKRGFSLDL